ncbi:MAG: metallophosphoesterase [Desulfovibrionaceae bacterium]|nr:metallophosphoesterase [Desulfovibrionaceae bacterium]MBF0514731.1 metallophosphoesterase [Desulfovibrionaceae bacterium]
MKRFACGRIAAALALVLLACLPARAEKLRFAVLGDCRGASPEDSIDLPVMNEINARLLALDPKPAFVLFTGDLVYRSKNAGQWKFDDWIRAVKPVTDAGIKIYPVLGNHELYQDERNVLHSESQEYYQKTFAGMTPQNGPKGYESLVYSFVSPGADAFFAVLDTYYIPPGQATAPYSNKDSFITEAQLDWLRGQLKNTTARFKFVAMHAPTFNPIYPPKPKCQEAGHCELWNILDQNGFAMSLASHLHAYARKTIGPEVDPAYHGGVVQVISGGAGAPLDNTVYFLGDTADWHVATVFNYLLVDIDGDTLTARAMGKADGEWKEIDRFTLTAPH